MPERHVDEETPLKRTAIGSLHSARIASSANTYVAYAIANPPKSDRDNNTAAAMLRAKLVMLERP